MGESLRLRLRRYGFNLFPAYFGTGGWITHIADDWQEIRLKIPLSWRTRNYMGTIFGGSMYGAVDPIYAMMLIKALGEDYEVWDKAATIRFRKPGESTLYATFEVPDAELDDIRDALETEDAIEREYEVELVDEAGVVHATVEKTVHVATDG